MKTCIVTDERFADHRTPLGHPERPARIAALQAALAGLKPDGIRVVPPRAASKEEILRAHTEEHYARIAATASQPFVQLDPDTSTSPRSFEIACLAAGAALTAMEEVMARRASNAFALVRPPGHHAESGRAMGFCLFNNVAIAARDLQRKHGMKRVLIVDWDVHHGNGAQEVFYRDGGVMFISLHQFPWYPGTGREEEIGEGPGEGRTLNIPLAAGAGDAEYAAAFERIVEPVARQFKPEFVLVSAGFDAHARDPLGGMRVTEEGFAAMTRSVLGIAADCCKGRLAMVLEGGYDPGALSASVLRVLEEMRGGG